MQKLTNIYILSKSCLSIIIVLLYIAPLVAQSSSLHRDVAIEFIETQQNLIDIDSILDVIINSNLDLKIYQDSIKILTEQYLHSQKFRLDCINVAIYTFTAQELKTLTLLCQRKLYQQTQSDTKLVRKFTMLKKELQIKFATYISVKFNKTFNLN